MDSDKENMESSITNRTVNKLNGKICIAHNADGKNRSSHIGVDLDGISDTSVSF